MIKTLSQAIEQGAINVADAAAKMGVSKERVRFLVTAGRIKVLFEEPFPGNNRLWLDREDVKKEAAARRN